MNAKSLVAGTTWNVLGQALPLAAAVFTIPLLIAKLGEDRFGFLSLAWAVIGYFSIFDLGLGRALIQLLSRRLGTEAEAEIGGVTRTAQRLLLALGILGGGVLALLAPWIAVKLNTPPALLGEATNSLFVLAFGVPVVILSASSMGVLTALHRFDIINIVRIPVGVFNFLLPLAILHFANNLAAVIGSLLALRVVTLLIYEYASRRYIRTISPHPIAPKGVIKELLGFGGWMTVTNIVGPAMVYFDRFLIGGFISLASVAFYATPYLLVTKLWIVSNAASTTLFPKFSSVAPERPHEALLSDSTLWLFLVMFPGSLFFVLFAREIITIWLGSTFAQNSTSVTQWLAIGTLTNGMAQIPFAYIQGRGRPRVTALLHLIELPIYALTLWLLLPRLGLVGAAIAWTLRNTADCVILYGIAMQLSTRPWPNFTKVASAAGLATGGSVLFLYWDAPLVVRAAVFSICCLTVALTAWRQLDSRQRMMLIKVLRWSPGKLSGEANELG
jgi:O-antigen/teichoic acid export membrane protein